MSTILLVHMSDIYILYIYLTKIYPYLKKEDSSAISVWILMEENEQKLCKDIFLMMSITPLEVT